MTYTGQILGMLTSLGIVQPKGDILISNQEYWQLRRAIESMEFVEDLARLALEFDVVTAANMVAMIEKGKVPSPWSDGGTRLRTFGEWMTALNMKLRDVREFLRKLLEMDEPK